MEVGYNKIDEVYTSIPELFGKIRHLQAARNFNFETEHREELKKLRSIFCTIKAAKAESRRDCAAIRVQPIDSRALEQKACTKEQFATLSKVATVSGKILLGTLTVSAIAAFVIFVGGTGFPVAASAAFLSSAACGKLLLINATATTILTATAAPTYLVTKSKVEARERLNLANQGDYIDFCKDRRCDVGDDLFENPEMQ